MALKKYYTTKLTKGIPASEENATTVARIISEHWVASHCIGYKVLNDNSYQFASKFFMSICDTVGVNNITTTEYQRQTNS